MSSTTGWQKTQNTGNLSFSNAGWGSSSASNLSSPLSNPDNWPQLGAGQENVPKLEVRQQNQGFSDNMQHPEATGWGAPVPSDPPAAGSGWGMPQSSGWGSVNGGGNNWSRQPQVDNGTALWGKQNQAGSGWGVPSSQPAAPSSWNSAPPPTSSGTGTSVQSSGTPHQEEQNSQPMPPPQSSSNPPPQQAPESWAAAAAAPPQGQPGHSQPPPPATSVQQSGAKDVENNQEKSNQEQERNEGTEEAPAVDPNDQVQKLVNSHEGWGKRPIQQNTSWDISDCPSYTGPATTKTGTEAWGKAPAAKPTTGWQGTSMPDPSPQQQQWGKSAGTAPVRGWGPSQPPLPPRPPWGGAQPNAPPPQTGWGDPRLPSPAPAMNANRWNTPTNPMPNSANQGWGAPSMQQQQLQQPQQQQQQQQTGWNTSGGSGDNSGWGGNVQRNTQGSNWGAPPPRPDNNWNQPQNMQRQSSVVDDGTSAWGDPTTYKSVNMWDKKQSVGGNMGGGDASQPKSESLGWGNPPPPQNNKPSPTGWGDVNPNKPVVDDGMSSWGKKPSQGSNWDQNSGWGIGKSDNSNGWSNADQGPQWGQTDNDAARVKPKDFGFTDRKTSTGSDNVFEDGQNGNGIGGDIGSGPSGVNYGQFPVASANNSGMPGLNGPRPMPPQNLMGVQAPYRQGPPMPPQLQNQIQQIRHAVMKGVIPQQILNPQFMSNPQHLNLLQMLIMKMTEYQQLSARMNLFSKPNLPPQLRSQQEQVARMLRLCQQQIQAHQRALTQNLVQQKAPPLHEKSNMGVGPNHGLGLDLPPSSGAMPPANSSISPFSMSSMSQSLPGAGGNPLNREQQSRLHTWRRPSAGFDNSSENSVMSNVLSPNAPHPSISDMIGGSVEQGGLLGLQQPDKRDKTLEMNGITPGGPSMNQIDQDASNLKNILADIGPPEFIPGKKWAGFRPIDPENDPDITPGSVAIAKTMSVNTVKDVDQVLNRDRYTMSQTDNTAQNSLDLQVKSQPSLASSFANITQDNPNTMSSGSAWSTGSGWTENNKRCLVLTNISPQIDLNTIHNLCSMSGKMLSFQPNYPVRGMTLVKFQTGDDATLAGRKLVSFGGSGMITANCASDQEVAAVLNPSSANNNNWNPGSSGRRTFGSSGTLLGNPSQGPPSFGSGPMMPNSDMGYPGETQNLWSTGDNGSAMHSSHGSTSWSTGANHAPSRPMGGMNMWNNAGLYDNSRVVSPPHSLLPENLLGEQSM